MKGSGSSILFTSSFEPPSLPSPVRDLFSSWRSAGRLGFLDLPGDDGLLDLSLAAAERLDCFPGTVIVDGIGGSALGLRALLSACPPRNGRRVEIVDSPDPERVRGIMSGADPDTSILVVITKSGSTAETLAVFLEIWPWLSGAGGQVVAITDPVSGDLRKLASDRGWPSLPVPPGVGGRYSVLSPVGVFPAALAGLDVRALLEGAGDVLADYDSNGASSLAARMAAAFLSGFSPRPLHVFFAYSDALYDSALWFSQLWAESLGKRRDLAGADVFRGQTPLACRGPADQHSLVQLFMEGPPDKFFTFVTTDSRSEALPGGFGEYPSLAWLEGRTLGELRQAEATATAAALEERGAPVARIHIPGGLSERAMGALFMSLEMATVLTGLALGIDPLDQPGVERGKQLTFKAMGRPGYR